MKGIELRIGNLVYQNLTDMVESYQKVTVINHYNNSIATEELNEHQIRLGDRYLFVGIPLTPEWLEQAGFVYLQSVCWQFGSMRIYNLSDEQTPRFRITLAGNELVIVKYVHQLQNLYFALTGEELTIKPQTR